MMSRSTVLTARPIASASSLRSATAAVPTSLPGKALKVRFLSAGDRALIVEFGERVDRGLSERVLGLDAIIRSNPPAGIVETVPTFRSLTVYYDPLLTSRAELQSAIAVLLDLGDKTRSGARLWRVPVCYEGEFAPDLAEVARLTGLT